MQLLRIAPLNRAGPALRRRRPGLTPDFGSWVAPAASEEAAMRILAATDGSLESNAALRAASRLLSPDDRQVDLLFVSPKPPRSKSGKIDHQAYRRRRF